MSIALPRYTVDDLEHFPDDGNRYEVLDGVLLVTPGPRRAHQLVASNLHFLLSQALQATGLAIVFSPGVVALPPGTQLQPNMLVQPASTVTARDWSDVHEHWLAVEILSRGSRIYDREFKRDAYFALGVAQVWLVDIEAKLVEVYKSPRDCQIVRDAINWRAPTSSGAQVLIDLATVFAGVE